LTTEKNSQLQQIRYSASNNHYKDIATYSNVLFYILLFAAQKLGKMIILFILCWVTGDIPELLTELPTGFVDRQRSMFPVSYCIVIRNDSQLPCRMRSMLGTSCVLGAELVPGPAISRAEDSDLMLGLNLLSSFSR